MKQLVPLFALTLAATGCGIFGGTRTPTLEMQNPPASGPVDVQLLDSSISPGEVYMRLVVHNRSDHKLLVDRRSLILSDGRNEWRPNATSKPFVTIKPNATSSKIKLTYEGAPAGQPSYDLVFKKGAFHQDTEAGQELTLPTVRLLVKKAVVATPTPAKPTDAGAAAR